MRPILLIALAACAGLPAQAENWIENADFESDEPFLWTGATLEREIVHSGNGALRLDEPADELSVGAQYGKPIELNQTEPEMVMAAFWVRFDARRQTGPFRGGVTFRTDTADGATLSWYGHFAIDQSEMGSWVYREHRWKPRAPIVRIRPSVYLRGCEGSIYIDDLYLGPATDLPRVPRRKIPVALTGADGRFTDWPVFEFVDFRSWGDRHVFHLGGRNESNLALSLGIRVKRPAPAYLTSAWGGQYWTIYSPERRELAQIYTDERLDLSRSGTSLATGRMCGLSDRAANLAPGGYVFLTEYFKRFLVYGTEKPEGEPYHDARTGQVYDYWDTVEITRPSKSFGISGIAAPFSLADLRSYRFEVTARGDPGAVRIRPRLLDAQDSSVPLYGLSPTAESDGRVVSAHPEVGPDGIPTGEYLARFPGESPRSVRVRAIVRLETPDGYRREEIDRIVPVTPSRPLPTAPRRQPLDMLGWGSPAYSLAPGASHGPDSMRRLIADARAAGVGKLLVHARTSKETEYPSRIAPSAELEWDRMRVAVNEGRKQGVTIYAAYEVGIAQPEDLEAHPGWAALDRGGEPNGWYCYNNPEVRAYHASLLAEIVSLYDVAGVSLDHCRPGGGCFCPLCAEGFKAKFGKPIQNVDSYDEDWINWKRDSVTEYMRGLGRAVRGARADAKFTGYVWGRLGPDKDRAGQDWPRWLQEGIMDFVAIGMYTPSTPFFRAQCRALRIIADRDLGGDTSRMYPMLGVTYIQRANPSYAHADAVIDRHLRAVSEEGLTCAGFFPFYALRPHVKTAAEHSVLREDN